MAGNRHQTKVKPQMKVKKKPLKRGVKSKKAPTVSTRVTTRKAGYKKY